MMTSKHLQPISSLPKPSSSTPVSIPHVFVTNRHHTHPPTTSFLTLQPSSLLAINDGDDNVFSSSSLLSVPKFISQPPPQPSTTTTTSVTTSMNLPNDDDNNHHNNQNKTYAVTITENYRKAPLVSTYIVFKKKKKINQSIKQSTKKHLCVKYFHNLFIYNLFLSCSI